MTGLSRCGRQYPDLARAILAAELRASKSGRAYVAIGCGLGEHWHVVTNASVNNHAARPDPFPPPVAALLDARDEVCQRCGYSGRLERHHRRAKASGGSKARSHTQCACNGVKLCRNCHEWAHRNPRQARAAGLIMLQSISKPGSIPFMAINCDPFDGDLGVGLLYPTCDGRWTSDEP